MSMRHALFGVVAAAVLFSGTLTLAGEREQREQRQEQRAREERQAQRAQEERQAQRAQEARQAERQAQQAQEQRQAERAAAQRQAERDQQARQELRQKTEAREQRLAQERATQRAAVDATNRTQLDTINRRAAAQATDVTAERREVKDRLDRQEQRYAQQRAQIRQTPNAGDAAALAELDRRAAEQRTAAAAELARLRDRDDRVLDNTRWDRQEQKLVNDVRVRQFRAQQNVQDQYADLAEQENRYAVQNREARQQIRAGPPTQREPALSNLMMTQRQQQELIRSQRERLETQKRAEDIHVKNARTVVRDREHDYWYDGDGSRSSLQPTFGRYSDTAARSGNLVPARSYHRDDDDHDRYRGSYWHHRYRDDDCDDDRFSFSLGYSSGSSFYRSSLHSGSFGYWGACEPTWYAYRPVYWGSPCPPFGYWHTYRPVYVCPPPRPVVYCKPIHIYHPGVISHWTYDCAPGCTSHSHRQSRLAVGLGVTIVD